MLDMLSSSVNHIEPTPLSKAIWLVPAVEAPHIMAPMSMLVTP